MPCSDSSSSIAFRIDQDDKFVSFDFAKITCGREISAETGYSKYCAGKSLPEILRIPYPQALIELRLKEEEEQFILYLEWDALRAAIVQYLGDDLNEKDIDPDRCRITSIGNDENGTEIALILFPPVELPKILPCSLGDKTT